MVVFTVLLLYCQAVTQPSSVLPADAAPKPEGSAGRLIGNLHMPDVMRPQAWGVLAVLIVLWKLRKEYKLCMCIY